MHLAGINPSSLVVAVVLIAIWWIFSGRFDLLHFGTGVATAIILAANYRRAPDGTQMRPLRFLLFVPWLFVQIVLSNLRVARMVLSVNMPIAPSFISQRPGVRGERGLALLGASTTLTPGTLTVDVGSDEIFIHALDVKSAQDTKDGMVARKVVRVFEDRTQ